jgi:hypothetical protein
MSPEAVDRRLRKQSELLEFCQRLRKETGSVSRLEVAKLPTGSPDPESEG